MTGKATLYTAAYNKAVSAYLNVTNPLSLIAVISGAYVTATIGLRSARALGGLSPSNIEDASDAFNDEVHKTFYETSTLGFDMQTFYQRALNQSVHPFFSSWTAWQTSRPLLQTLTRMQ